LSVSSSVGATWENYLRENLGEHWQKLGFVTNKGENMRILIESVPVIDVKTSEMSDPAGICDPCTPYVLSNAMIPCK